MAAEQDLARAAVESAFRSDVTRLFGNLILALAVQGGSPEAVEQARAAFERGYRQSIQALRAARKVIEEACP
ncbi:MAG: hypothetical protein JXR77_12995 [Lentisphaeria bacterium]|nr:hypothetical protein [Lentisphaeria bacterium]